MKQATIILRDEVNIKIEGLDLDCRKALVNAFKYENPAARYMPAVRLGRWDGKIAYFQLGGSTYTNLLPHGPWGILLRVSLLSYVTIKWRSSTTF